MGSTHYVGVTGSKVRGNVMSASRLYTGAGDKGTTTCIFTGRLVPKSHECIEFVGALDEAEAALGFAQSLLEQQLGWMQEYASILERMQLLLFRAGFTLAGHRSLVDEDVSWVEDLIDKFSEDVGYVFTLNGGHPVSAAISLARALIRRAERWLWKCVEKLREEGVEPPREDVEVVAKLLNRLSDLAFALQNSVNKALGVTPRPVLVVEELHKLLPLAS